MKKNNKSRYYALTARCHGRIRKIATAVAKNNSLIFTPALKADSFMALKGNIKCHAERVYSGKNGDNNLTWNYAIKGVALSTGNKKISGHSAAADDIIILEKTIKSRKV